MPRSSATSPATAVVVVGVILVTTWRLWQTTNHHRRRSSGNETSSSTAVARFLLTSSVQNGGKVLDLRTEASFDRRHVVGSHNIPVASLWDDNRWYELPEQHESLVVLIPVEGAPEIGMDCEALAKAIKSRRAEGSTATLVFDEALGNAARESGLLFEEGLTAAAGPLPTQQADEKGSQWTSASSPSTTLFTPSPFLTRAAAVMEPHLKHSWLPLTCIDIGCGAGRDAVWLAKRGWRVTAMDCWNQVLQKAETLATRNGVSDRVKIVQGKVKHTGEIHLSDGVREPPTASVLVDDQEGGQSSGAAKGSHLERSATATDDVGGVRVISPTTPPTEYESYALVVVIRFLERSAFDTLARLVDPRGGYILLSTFIEEERETATRFSGRGGGQGKAGGREEPGTSVQTEKRDSSPQEGAVTDYSYAKHYRKKGKPGSTAAALEAAAAAATLARWPHASPRDHRKILRRGELARVFGDRHGFEVLEDSVTRLPDGRPVACFLARRMPLVVSSPSNASVASSVSSPWRDDLRQLHRQDAQLMQQPWQRQHQQGSGLFTPASTFGASNDDPGPSSSAFLGKTLLSPTPEAAPRSFGDKENKERHADGSNTFNPKDVGVLPASSFPIQSMAVSDDDGDDDGGVVGGKGAAEGHSSGERRNGGDDRRPQDGRAAMWSSFYAGTGMRSRRDFTATRAASSRRRLAEAAAAATAAERAESR